MPTPFHLRQAAPTNSTDGAKTCPTTASSNWCCTQCGKKLGVHRDGRMHLRYTGRHEYFVSYPVVANCRGCGTLNQATVPKS